MDQLQLQLVGAREPGFAFVIIQHIVRTWYSLERFHVDGSRHDDYSCPYCSDNFGFGGGTVEKRVHQIVDQKEIHAVTEDEFLANEWVKAKTKTWYGIDESTPIYDKWDRDPEAKSTYKKTFEIEKIPTLIITGTIISLGVPQKE